MAALSGSACLLLGAVSGLFTIRDTGGWRCLLRLRRGAACQCGVQDWNAVPGYNRVWFYAIPLLLLCSVCLLIVGLVVVAQGDAV